MTQEDLEQINAIMQAALAPLQADVAALKVKINEWPDMHFLHAAAQRQIAEARDAREYRQRTEIKLDEIYTSMATSSEIARLREDVSASLSREDDLDLRITTLESRLGVRNPLVPE